jgi:hypothetical protein
MRIEFKIDLFTIPVVGDIIDLGPECLKEVSTKLKNREFLMEYGKTFVVIERTKRIGKKRFYRDEDWVLKLDTVDPLIDNM